jgi:hypothetical protein
VGHERASAPDEAYFVVEAPSEEAANAQANAYMKTILKIARSELQYEISLHEN